MAPCPFCQSKQVVEVRILPEAVDAKIHAALFGADFNGADSPAEGGTALVAVARCRSCEASWIPGRSDMPALKEYYFGPAGKLRRPDPNPGNRLRIRGTDYEVIRFEGEVTAASRQFETVVSSSGGGSSGSPASVSSTTYTHDQVFLKDHSGNEHSLDFVNWNIAVRAGHSLRCVWLRKGRKDILVAVENRSLNEVKYNASRLAALHGPSALWWIGFIVLAVAVPTSVGLAAAGIAAVVWIVSAILGHSAASELRASGRLLRA